MTPFILMLFVKGSWVSTGVVYSTQSTCVWAIRSQSIDEDILKCVEAETILRLKKKK